ncbi:MAG: ABC transporter permease [Candidatus Scalindua sp.]|nr:ABC transporter permease [Candidatus Scalindua sp.]MCR4343881.1 ABC transporter permease [Candidatus Scalindua sp.]
MVEIKFRQKIDLLWLLTKKEITLKYRRSSLGVLWSLLNPIFLSIVLFIAFKIFMRIGLENYHFFLLAALFPWNWFSASVTMSTETLVSNVNLIKLTRFPIYFLVISTVLAQLFNLIFALPIIIGLAYFYGGGPGISWLIGFPLLVLSQLIVTIGICLAISIVNACFRDMEHIVGVLLSMLFWMTPVIYPLDRA